MTQLKEKPIDLTKVSVEELEKVLNQRKQEEKEATEKAQKNYKKKVDAFVKTKVAQMADLSAKMKALKMEILQRGNDLHEEMYEVYGKQPKELKEFSLISEDGMHKLTLQRTERQALDETAEVAISIIKEVFKAKFEARNKGMYEIIDGLLMKNQKGDYDERLVAKLRKYESTVDDKEFSNALDELSKAYYTCGTSTYARAYNKDAKNNKWVYVEMQFSSI